MFAVVLTLTFDDGTPQLTEAGQHLELIGDLCAWDHRTKTHRARACDYAQIVRALHNKVPYKDQAKQYATLGVTEAAPLPLRPYQQEALDGWLASKRRKAVLPTGAGKTYVALKAIIASQRHTSIGANH